MTHIEQLYSIFIPDHYKLSLDIKRLQRTFSGVVVISGKQAKPDQPIKLHSKDLRIKKALINDIPTEIASGDNDEIILTPQSRITSLELVVTIEFSGKITDPMHGMYPCYYTHDGKQKELIATQFESHHAREVFPCIDEPSAKATFDVELVTESHVQVLGNMPIAHQQPSGKQRLKTAFETSPKMSPYLLAFVIGELHNTSGKTSSGVDVSIWATQAQTKKSMAFALDIAIRSIEFFDDYFGVPYPLPKADHVALPDFSSAAMENWGLITYREACLLADTSTAVSTKQMIASVIGHETSHQWFGNLVTMAWWDDLWLNESFANMMQHVVVDALFPQWHMWQEFASHESLSALRRDSLPGVQPVKVAVHHPDEIGTLFDPAIVYAKGGNLLNMLRAFIGEAAFQEGLTRYFQDHAYSNTTGDNLWSALTATSGKDIGVFMENWLTQSGFPVVNISSKKDQLIISQSHFQIGAKPQEKLWSIPLFANTEELPTLLDERSITVAKPLGVVKLNKDDQSYFITHYDDNLSTKLLAHLDEMSDIDKLQLLNEASLLSKALTKSAADLIDLLSAVKHEPLQPVWDVMSLIIADLKRFTDSDTIVEDQLKHFVRDLALPMYKKLGWKMLKNDSEDTVKLRATIIGLMLYSEDNDAVSHALRIYDDTKDIAKINGELRTSILGAAVRFSPHHDTVVKDLLAYHHSTSSNDLQRDICVALSSTRDTKTAQKLLSLLTDGSTIRPQDVTAWYAHMIRNRFTRDTAWKWITTNWDWIQQQFKNDHHYDNFIYYSAHAFSTTKDKQRFDDFFLPKRNEIALQRTIDIGGREIASRIEWIANNKKAVSQKLAAL